MSHKTHWEFNKSCCPLEKLLKHFSSLLINNSCNRMSYDFVGALFVFLLIYHYII